MNSLHIVTMSPGILPSYAKQVIWCPTGIRLSQEVHTCTNLSKAPFHRQVPAHNGDSHLLSLGWAHHLGLQSPMSAEINLKNSNQDQERRQHGPREKILGIDLW